MTGLGICSFSHPSFAHLLKLLKSIRSDPSGQMSDCEQIAQVARVKRATMIKSLRKLMTNEQISESLRLLTKNEQT